MAYIDAENTLMTVTAADLGTAMTGPIVDLGSKGGFLSPLYIDAKLTKKMTSGSIDSFTLQSSASDTFSSPVNEVTITVPASAPQTSKPCTLAQFHAPIKPSNRYIRLKAAATSPVGGELFAAMQNGIKGDM